MQSAPSLAILLASLACLSACSTTTQVQTRVNADPSASFSRYHTYTFAPPASTIANMDPSVRGIVQHTIAAGLSARGITPSENPEFIIVYHVTTADKSSAKEYNQWQYANPGTGKTYAYGAFMGNQISETHYTQGTFIVDFVDVKTKKTFWHGTSVGPVGTRQQNEQELITGVNEMLAQIPSGR